MNGEARARGSFSKDYAPAVFSKFLLCSGRFSYRTVMLPSLYKFNSKRGMLGVFVLSLFVVDALPSSAGLLTLIGSVIQQSFACTKLFGQVPLFQKHTSLCSSTDITYSARQVAAEKKAYLYSALESQKGILDS